MRTGRPVTNISGNKYGLLRVLGRVKGVKPPHWRCRCACGAVVVRAGAVLTGNRLGSCGHGCVAAKKSRRPSQLKHGYFGKPEYTAWMEMRRRCYDPKRKEYDDYGGRGITVCAAWDDPQTGFAVFLRHMGPRPARGYTVGRKDNDGHYCPENCEWQTISRQNRNKTTTIRLRWRGRTLAISDWADETGLPRSCLYQRYRKGWAVRDILTEPHRSVPVGKA